MSINQLILRNLKKNLKNYYLYVFALIFTVALYFSFVTLQYDPSMDQTKGTIKGAASIRAASILLVAIVTIFILYANTIFIKRRSKEIGLFQLIGMTKNRIFGILSAENFFLYFASLVIGIFIGFAFSRLIIMILFKVTKVNAVATLHFSSQALIQAMIVFSAIYLLIMLMNFLFIKRQSILALFRVTSSTEAKAKKLSLMEILIGILGILFIIAGYYLSSKLFDGEFPTINKLFTAMITILALVIIGTYLFYKGSVSFVFYLIRKRKNGFLNINEVLSLTSIMFRMKSNALLLTIITTVSALAIGLLTLSYISYYSAEKSAKNMVAADFSFINKQDASKFKKELDADQIKYKEKMIDVIQVHANVRSIIETNLDAINFDPKKTSVPVVSEKVVKGLNLSKEDIILTGFDDALKNFLSFKDSGKVKLIGQKESQSLNFIELRREYIISSYFGQPIVVVDDTVFEGLKNDIDQEIQKVSSLFIGIDIRNEDKIEKANDIFQTLNLGEDSPNRSKLEITNAQKNNFGLVMFIVGFLGLTFLVTSGCILYFKQMDESEEEKSNYTILRKLGFTQSDLLKGIQAKQLFNFGIPLFIGLLHSYFAVKSGWFFFGTELWTPMIIVMLLYTALYSIFGILSVMYYKKVIKEAL
ncbi:FtsX-like permease family protein [Bacillus massilinigeriensis]|uniref:FtsX-like permease family protein n=1 Tax=Bacillus massilionigeriensis TaxID=1805475 RepID=UPI00096ADD9C|nr:ABC transporter permease [Bacillus massilionigeriensis]